jgi:hypothetical protein
MRMSASVFVLFELTIFYSSFYKKIFLKNERIVNLACRPYISRKNLKYNNNAVMVSLNIIFWTFLTVFSKLILFF